jgi:trypsin-like peptidase
MIFKKSALTTHFMAELLSQFSRFLGEEVSWGMFAAGVAGIGVYLIRVRLAWEDAWDQLLGLLCVILWVVCFFLVLIVYRTTKSLWRQGHVPSSNEKRIMLTDAEGNRSHEKIYFRIHLVFTALVFFVVFVVCGIFSGLFAYRTATTPILTQQELADLGSRVVVQIVVPAEISLDGGTIKHYSAIATGFWISDKGYVLTCLDAVRDHRDLYVAAPLQQPLSQHILTMNSFFYDPSPVIWKDEKSNLAVLRNIHTAFDKKNYGDTGIVVANFADKLSQPGENIDRVGFDSRHSPVTEEINVDSAFGIVVRPGIDFGGNSTYALFLSVPFSTTGCGAPVMNSKGRVVGMVEREDLSDGSQVHSKAIPSIYIIDLLKHVEMKN